MRRIPTNSIYRKLCSALVTCTLILICFRGNAQISVTATAGTLGPTAYTTLGAAFTQINGGTHQGVITISVTGTTFEPVVAQLNGSGTGGANYTSVTVKPAIGVVATISSSIALDGPIYLFGASNVTIDGSNTVGGTTQDLTISNTNTNSDYGIKLGTPGIGCNNIKIKNCIITGSGTTGANNSGAGILTGGTTSYTYANAVSSDNTIQNNSISGWVQGGVVILGPNPSLDVNWNITGNTMNDCGFQGVLVFFGQNIVVSYNTITNTVLNGGTPVSGIIFSWTITGAEVFGNKITGTRNTVNQGAYGIYMDLLSGSNINIYNNFIANTTSVSVNNLGSAYRNGHGFYMDAGGGVNLYHNSINQSVNQNGTGAHYTSAICFDPFATGQILNNSIKVVDNIAVNTETNGTANYGILSTAPNSIFTTINYNDYVATGNNLGYIGGARTSIANIQTGFGGNANSITSAPVWVSATDLHLQVVGGNNPLNAGTFILTPNINFDIDVNTRTTPTIGADELSTCTLPSITGNTTICPGTTTTLANATTGGTWTSSSTTVATVTLGPTGGGIVTGVANAGGTTTITYATAGGCTTTTVVTVTARPAAISGTPAVCVGSTTQLSNTVAGTWTAGTTSVATITSGGGLVSGVAQGSSIITFTSTATGCTNTVAVTVSPLPGSITGITTVCPGATTTLSNSLTGGSWSSGTTTMATITPGSGIVTGVSPGGGTSLITYTSAAGCSTTTLVTVSAAPSGIVGNATVCAGSAITLSNNTAGGGTWSSSTTTVATVTPGPFTSTVVSSLTTGNTTVTFTSATNACTTTTVVTVTAAPSVISAGTTTICPSGGTTTLSNSVAGGTWSSGTTTAATVVTGPSATTTVTGVAGPGSSIITYSLGTGCSRTITINVSAPPPPITGTLTVCVGATTVLTDVAAGGGTWTSATTTVATVTPGLSNSTTVTGVLPGTSVITFTSATTGCTITQTVTVIAVPSTISGPTSVCVGSTIQLSSTVGGGTWTSATTGVATVTPGPTVTPGIVSGAAQGTSVITYSNGCASPTTTVTVFAPPAPIAGPSTACAQFTTTLTNTSVGGTWTSSNTNVATITSYPSGTGVYTGSISGTTVISYSTGCGVATVLTVTINTRPVNIFGATTICLGSSTTLSNDGAPVGTWSSGTTTVATVDPITGTVYSSGGVGTSLIVASNQCGGANVTFTVASPTAITGTTTFCQNASTTLSNGVSGGTWSSSNTGLAVVDLNTGVVSGVPSGGAGSVNITYTITGGCFTVTTVTTTIAPSAINGIFGTCEGSSTCLTDATPGGVWTSSNTSIATVSSTGCVFGVSAGNVLIVYAIGTCTATASVTINPLPTPITGPSAVCVNSTITLNSSAAPPGTWTSSNPAIAAVDQLTGDVTGVAAGPATITYMSTAGCFVTKTITVNPLPAGITGTLAMCAGQTMPLSSTTGGGSWSSSITTVATITSGGVVGANSTASGTTIISYTMPATGCYVTASFTVNPLPTAIIGANTMCTNATTALTDGIGGGTWTSTSPGIAGIGLNSGVVTSGSLAGTTTIIYTLPTTCSTSMLLTVNQTPATITGNTSVCVGLTTNLSNTVAGGTWSSANTNITIGSLTGVVTGMAPGTSEVTYTRLGCFVTTTVTVNPLPAIITGPTNVCVGSSVSLTDATANGTWSSSNTNIATIDINSGVLTGGSQGSAIVTYMLTTGCIQTANMTVNQLPTAMAGVTLCAGQSATLSNGVSGGTWSSNSTAVTVVTGPSSTTTITTANVTSQTAATVTYSLSTGCFVTTTVVVNPMPSPIVGGTSACVGSTTTLSNLVSGGLWSSSSTNIATVTPGPGSGTVFGVSAGVTRITYTLTSSGCFMTTSVNINALPTVIGGNTTICAGSTTQLSNGTTGGTWSSSNTNVATISTTGLATGVSTGPGSPGGTAVVTYTLGTGCIQTVTITVNALPLGITGNTTICVGSTTTLSDVTPSGTWSSGTTTVATVGTGNGIVLGVSGGTARITYTLITTGCTATTQVTVNPLPTVIGGLSTVCEQSNINLSNGTSGGTWSSSNTNVLTVAPAGAFGNVTGLNAGVADVTYTVGTGCYTVKTVTVTVQPAPITGGPLNICQQSTATLSDLTPGGVWTSGNTTIATVDISGNVTAGTGPGSVGTTNITYSIWSCRSVASVTTNTQPGTITGVKSLCAGGTTQLSNATTGGVWTSSNTGVATVNATRFVGGAGVGTANITYTIGICSSVTTVTVNVQPTTITGVSSICNTNSTTFSNGTPGGTWSSQNTTIATVNTTTGDITALSVGCTVITYTMPGGCFSVKNFCVTTQPTTISGTKQVCLNFTTQLSNTASGGVWSVSTASQATISVNGSGLVRGEAAGVGIVTYTIGTCAVTASVTVNPPPSQMTGAFYVCQGSCTTLGDLTPLGTWTSSNPSVATIAASTGIACGSALGTTNISYTLPTGCYTTHILSVIASPAPIAGNGSVCVGGNTQLTDITNGGQWTSSNTNIATIDPVTGFAGGAASGGVIISYTLGTGCRVVAPLAVNAFTPITGNSSTVCVGQTTNLSNTTIGGTWTSGNTSVATVNPVTGVVTGAGTGGGTLISYTLPSGCTATISVTVLPLPPVITGPSSVCLGSTITLSDANTGGVWSSSNLLIADINPSTGDVTGMGAGNAIITYTQGGCPRTTTITVNPISDPITGNTNLCMGSPSSLSDATPGGTWTSSNTAVATIDATGLVTPVSPGTTTISYVPPTGCAASVIVTVNPVPGAITGNTTICVGGTTQLSNAVTGGAWTSSNPAVAGVVFATGLVTGFSPGTVIITNQALTGCFVTTTVTVNPLPTISGPTQVCQGSQITLFGGGGVGTWTSSNSSIATIDLITGTVSGVASGNVQITYTIGTGCTNTYTVQVNPLPTAILGVALICTGQTTQLGNNTPGGTWSSSNTFVGTIDINTGVSGSNAPATSTFIVTYTLPTGCYVTTVVTVTAPPGPISGPSAICEQDPFTMTNPTPGGIWSSLYPVSATIDPVTGNGSATPHGVGIGFTVITYTMGGGNCFVTKLLTVNPIPDPITGNGVVCHGLTTTFSDPTPGGVWSSQNTGIATIDPNTGVATGINAGPGAVSTTITYKLPTGCSVSTTLIVNPLPLPITGNTNICVGGTRTLSDSPGPGVWSSGNTSIATIDATSGVVTGVNYSVGPPPGTTVAITNITYTINATGCIQTTTVAVHPLPQVFFVTGGGSYCSADSGVHVGLSGSEIGVQYFLYLGSSTPTGPIAGTGGPLDFGLQMPAGNYTVVAMNSFTTCSIGMTGHATVSIIPSITPSVTINASTPTVICAGTAVTFTPAPVNGGSSPTYRWFVNGVHVSNTNTYTFVPANGDVVSVILNSNATCAISPFAYDTVTMSVITPRAPSVSVLVSPNDTVCTRTPVTFTAVPFNGGLAPLYKWYVNGIFSGTGSVYSYSPVNGDQVYVTMYSNALCRLADSAQSNVETIAVMNPVIPVVTITASPGSLIVAGTTDTLTAHVTNGVSPTYQWVINGTPVPGATDSVLIRNNFGYPRPDSVGCLVTNSIYCNEQTFGWIYVVVHPVGVTTVSATLSDISVIPNPNKGVFTISGTLSNNSSEDVYVELTDMLGQVVYRGNIKAKNGRINKEVTLGNTVSNGMYLLNIRSDGDHKVFHLVVEQ